MVDFKNAKLQLVLSMVLFGTIGLFVRFLSLPSSMIALCRAWIGGLFLLAALAVQKKKICMESVKKNRFWLLLSGAFLGFNWIALFEAYRYTSVAVATVCYYMAPIIVIFSAPVLLKEKLSRKKIVCAIAAMVGMALLSFKSSDETVSPDYWTGILLGILAAGLYASVVLCNKQIKGMDAQDKTVIQLLVSAITMLPYCLMTTDFSSVTLDVLQVVMLILVGIVHTGVTYLLYFGSMEKVSGQSVAVISYIDPVVAVLLSVLILKEHLSDFEWIGAGLILSSTLLSEINWKGEQSND